MYLEDLRVHLTNLLERLLVECGELRLRLLLRCLETLELCRDIRDVLTLHKSFFFL